MEPVAKLCAFLNRESPGEHLVLPFVSGFAAALAATPLGEYFQDSREMIECQLESWERFGYDAVHSLIDPVLEAEVLGCKVRFSADHYPYITHRIFEDRIRIDRLPFFNPGETRRTAEVLKSIRIMRDWLGSSALVTGNISGPVTISSQLTGIPAYLEQVECDISVIARLLRCAVHVCTRWGCELINAGAQIITVHDNFNPLGILPEQFISRFLMVHYRSIFSQFKKTGDVVTACYIPKTDIDTLSLLVSRDLDILSSPILSTVGDRPPPLQNISIMRTVDIKNTNSFTRPGCPGTRTGNQGDFHHSGCRCLYTSDGEVPVDTPMEKLHAFVRAMKKCSCFKAAA